MNWRDRFGRAIQESGCTQTEIAKRAGVAPETVSHILNASDRRPGLDTVTRIAHVAGVSVGWLLGEDEYRLTAEQQKTLREAADLILRTLP